MSDNKKSVLLEVSGDLDMSPDNSICRLEVAAADGSPLTAQIIVDAVVDMLTHYYSLEPEYWERLDDKDLDS